MIPSELADHSDSPIRSVVAATAFAATKHRNQRRKDLSASPYINHPIALADLLANEGHVTDVAVLMAALLHDTIEDTGTSAEEIKSAFGSEVAVIVVEVTDDKTLKKAERKKQQVLHAASISDQAKLVKLADKICNLRDIKASPPADWGLERKREYYDWAKQVVDQMRGVHPVLESLFDAQLALRP